MIRVWHRPVTEIPKRPASNNTDNSQQFGETGEPQFTPTTTQENRNYAKNKHIGLPITDEKDKGTYRLYAGNPNGLKLGPKGGDWSDYCEAIKRLQVDTGCLFEINLDTTKYSIKNILHDTARNVFDHSKLDFCSSSVPSQNDFKPGGTLVVTQGNFKGRVIDSGCDALGRWTYQTLGGKANRNITIVSAYQVCDQDIVENSKVKTLTATAQQTRILRLQGHDETPRKAFVADLRKFLTKQRKLKNGIFLVGDFNEVLDVSYDGMTKLASDFELTDVMYHVIGDDNFATYDRGTTRVDCALADGWVAETIAHAC